MISAKAADVKTVNEVIPATVDLSWKTKKILKMDRYCDFFVAPPLSQDDELFKAICHVIELRNNLVHANITAEMREHLLKTQEGVLVVTPRKVGSEKYGISGDYRTLSNGAVIRTMRLVKKYLATCLQSMEEHLAEQLDISLNLFWITYVWPQDKNAKMVLYYPPNIPRPKGMIGMSTKLDGEYYYLGEEEYVATSEAEIFG